MYHSVKYCMNKRYSDITHNGINIYMNKSLQDAPFTYMNEYKNPCWLEHLSPDYMTYYKMTPYHNNHGVDQINKMIPIFNKRLEQDEQPWRLRCLPYFFLLGVTKCGTTDFFDAILKHPAVHGLWIKEPMYWNRERYPGGTVVHKGTDNSRLNIYRLHDVTYMT